MNAKTECIADGGSAPIRLRLALSALCLLAASLTTTAMADDSRRTTYRILQNLVPKPYATYTMVEPPATELVRFMPQAAFGTNQAKLTPELRAELHGVLTALEAYQRIERVELIGHGDGNPRPEYGQWLAQKRTESVRAFFIERGVANSMVQTRGVPQSAATDRARVEILVTVRGRR